MMPLMLENFSTYLSFATLCVLQHSWTRRTILNGNNKNMEQGGRDELLGSNLLSCVLGEWITPQPCLLVSLLPTGG